MTMVCICGSFRHYGATVGLRRTLLAAGVAREWPEAGLRRDPESMTPVESRAAILLHVAHGARHRPVERLQGGADG